MSINVKKYTKDQMVNMVEDAQAEVQELRRITSSIFLTIPCSIISAATT